mmetsp:Transcript_10864/g.31844  ORF Transcript_10864/g.31844 Transcript_10864/m.31844 type:complete len:247 (+) Transcript_10864:1581-2321(+)
MRSCCMSRAASKVSCGGSVFFEEGEATGEAAVVGLAGALLPGFSSRLGSASARPAFSPSTPTRSSVRLLPSRSDSSTAMYAPPAFLTTLPCLAMSGLSSSAATASFACATVTLLMTVTLTSSSSMACLKTTSISWGGSSSGCTHRSRSATSSSFLTQSVSCRGRYWWFMRVINFTCFSFAAPRASFAPSFSLSSCTWLAVVISIFRVCGRKSISSISVTSSGSGSFGACTAAGSRLAASMKESSIE